MLRKTAVIIGASSEIGRQTAKKFAEEGFNLALTYNSNPITETFGNVDQKSYCLDLTNAGKISEVFDQIINDFKTLDVLVFCAGVAQKRELIFDLKDKELDNLFEVNIKSAIRCVREFTKSTLNTPSNIVLVGSFVEKNGCSCESAYTATKSALSGLCRSLSTELGNLDKRCNVVAPGFIDTKMNNNLSQEEKDEIANMTPLKRLGTCEDVANAIYFLASEQASFITGQTLFVDGGLILD